MKIEVFQLVKHNFLFNGEGFYAEEEDGEEEEEEEDVDIGDLEDEEEAGILNSEQEWLWDSWPSNLPNDNAASTGTVPLNYLEIKLIFWRKETFVPVYDWTTVSVVARLHTTLKTCVHPVLKAVIFLLS